MYMSSKGTARARQKGGGGECVMLALTAGGCRGSVLNGVMKRALYGYVQASEAMRHNKVSVGDGSSA